ncbi:unnamed protein product [Chrysodeixis includens]|uniref:Uncharacterized protein n=1 Tax=Chrysodeixis includens TaxID=689277 RepID=A0A9N8KVS5_CHRIL|nr:unnamed protein product [Chrysodeixis includens]
MQTNVQIDTKALRHSPEHGKGGKGGNRFTAEARYPGSAGGLSAARSPPPGAGAARGSGRQSRGVRAPLARTPLRYKV